MTSHAILPMLLALAVGCGDDASSGDAAPMDGSIDADAGDGGGATVSLPTLPTLTPCPPGWREVMVPEVPVPVCDPWPDSDAAACPDGQAHFPGEAGCVDVGPACPAGAYPEGLPTDRTIRYVDASAAAGGDGSMASPYASLAEALRNSGAGDVVAIAKGTYDEDLVVRGGITLWGACAAETHLLSSRPTMLYPVVDVQGADVEVRGVTIGGARPGAIIAGAGRSATFDGVVVESAILGLGVAAGTLVAREVVVRDVAADGSGNFGNCLTAQGGATMELSRVVVERCVSAGLTSDDPGTTLRVEDTVVRDVRAHRSGTLGRGISVQTGSRGELSRVVIESVRELGVIASGTDTVVDATDVWIRDTLPEEDGSYGRGFSAQRGGALIVRRSRVSGTREAALVLVSSAQATLEDLVVHDTLPQTSDDLYGFGLASLETPIAARRVLIATSHYVGVNLEGAAATSTLEDLTVVATRSAASDGRFGRGLNVQYGPSVDVSRARFAGNRDVAIAVFEAPVRFVDLSVEGTLARECAETTCTDFPAGIGVGVYSGADVDIDTFLVDGSALAGIQVAGTGELDLVHGVVSNNPIGANVQVAGYDVDRLSDDVAYRDNGTNLDAMDLPVPTAADPIQDH